MAKKWVIIGYGKVGWHADSKSVKETNGSSKSSSSGGCLDQYLRDAVEGCRVYDASKADDAAFTRFIISGPMCDTDLEGGEESPFTAQDRQAAASMVGPGGLEDAFAALATHAATHPEYTGLDRVSAEVWFRLLRESVPGVRFGTVQNSRVVWEDGEVVALDDSPYTGNGPRSGDELNRAIRDGRVLCDVGTHFQGKPIDAGRLHGGDLKPLRGRKVVLNSWTEDGGKTATLTGRSCWAYSGVGAVWELILEGESEARLWLTGSCFDIVKEGTTHAAPTHA